MLLIAIIGSFLIGVMTTVVILYRFSKLPEKPTVDEQSEASERTRNVAPIEIDQLLQEEKNSKSNIFEEKTRQVNILEFADLLHLDREEIVAEPVPQDNEEQKIIAYEDSQQLQAVIEKSSPFDKRHPQVMIQVIPPSRYVFTTNRNHSCGLPN